MRGLALGSPLGQTADAKLDWIIKALREIERASQDDTPLPDLLRAISELTTAADKGLYFTGPDAPALFDLTAFARSLLDDADAPTARRTLFAAPIDALAYSGLQLNGSMEVSQEKGTAAATANAEYIVDGWLLNRSGTNAVSVQQVADAPPGYTNSLKITVGTAEASLGAGSNVSLSQRVEGFRTSRLVFGTANASPLSIAFWVKAHRAGAYSGSLRNNAGNRSYPFSFAVNAADTWEYKTVTVTGDTTGTWIGNTNAIGLRVNFTMAAGSSFVGTAGAWTSGDLRGATGTTNGVAATSDTFQITGVVILPGIELPPADRAPFIMRPFHAVHDECRRYWEKSYDYATAPGTASVVAGIMFARMVLTNVPNGSPYGFAVRYAPKRATPVVTVYGFQGGAGMISNEGGTDQAANSAVGNHIGENNFNVYNQSGGAVSLVQAFAHWVVNARL